MEAAPRQGGEHANAVHEVTSIHLKPGPGACEHALMMKALERAEHMEEHARAEPKSPLGLAAG